MMSIENRFSEDEIFLLISAPSMVGSAIATAGKSGLFGTLKEMSVNVKAIMAGVKNYPDNALIQGLLPALEEREEALEKAKKFRDRAKQRMKDKEIDSVEKFHRQTLEDCRAVTQLLQDKTTPQEAKEYKEWLLAVAEKVAMAAKEGGFLGIGGERFSAGEKDLLNKIADALGTSTTLT
jgi:hypothetical protein